MQGRIRLALVDRHTLFRDVLGRWLAETARDIEVVASVGSVDELRTAPGWGAQVVMIEPGSSPPTELLEDLTSLVCAGSRVVLVSEHPDPVTERVAARAGVAVQLTRAALGTELLAALRAPSVSAPAS